MNYADIRTVSEKDTELIIIERNSFWEVVDSWNDSGYTVMKNFNRVLASGLCRSDRQLKKPWQ